MAERFCVVNPDVMRVMSKKELAARMGVSKTTMGVYMRSIEYKLPHYSRHQTLLTPDQAAIVIEHFGIT